MRQQLYRGAALLAQRLFIYFRQHLKRNGDLEKRRRRLTSPKKYYNIFAHLLFYFIVLPLARSFGHTQHIHTEMAKGHDNKWDADKVAVVASSFYYICVSSTSFPFVWTFFGMRNFLFLQSPPQRSRRRKNTFQLIAHWIFIYKRGWSPVIVTDERFYVSTFAPWTSLDRWHLDIFHFKTLENIDIVNIGRQERDCETLTGILLRNSRTKIISTAFSYIQK